MYIHPWWQPGIDAVVNALKNDARDGEVSNPKVLLTQVRRHLSSVNQALRDGKLKYNQVLKHKQQAAEWNEKFFMDFDNGSLPQEFIDLGVEPLRRSPRKQVSIAIFL